jgi:hypothetical protein
MKSKILILSLFFSISGFSQENRKNKLISLGIGVMYYPTGQIIGFSRNYNFDYFFSKHFGAKLNADFGAGETNDKYYFDTSKSTILSIGILYAPIKRMKSLNINASFSNYQNTRIFGTKEERIDTNNYLSNYASFQKETINGLNLGVQIPFYQNQNFLFACRADGYASWLQFNGATTKLVVGYKF